MYLIRLFSAETAARSSDNPGGTCIITIRVQVTNSNPLPLNLSIYTVTIPSALVVDEVTGARNEPISLSKYKELVSYIATLRLHPKRAFISSNNGVYINKPTGVSISNAALTLTDSNYAENSNITIWLMIPSTYDPEDAEFSMEIFTSLSNVSIDRIQ